MKACLHCKTFFDNDDPEIENNKCPECGLELVKTLNMPADIESDTLKIEIESRSEWIRKMNEILGYENSDGMHSEPTPHEIAKELREFVQEVAGREVAKGRDDWELVNRSAEIISKLRTPPV